MVTCKRPGCLNPPRPPKDATRRRPLYCSNACKVAAHRERKKQPETGTLPT